MNPRKGHLSLESSEKRVRVEEEENISEKFQFRLLKVMTLACFGESGACLAGPWTEFSQPQ